MDDGLFSVRLHTKAIGRRYYKKFRFDFPPQLINKYSRMTVYQSTLTLENTRKDLNFLQNRFKDTL